MCRKKKLKNNQSEFASLRSCHFIRLERNSCASSQTVVENRSDFFLFSLCSIQSRLSFTVILRFFCFSYFGLSKTVISKRMSSVIRNNFRHFYGDFISWRVVKKMVCRKQNRKISFSISACCEQLKIRYIVEKIYDLCFNSRAGEKKRRCTTFYMNVLGCFLRICVLFTAICVTIAHFRACCQVREDFNYEQFQWQLFNCEFSASVKKKLGENIHNAHTFIRSRFNI